MTSTPLRRLVTRHSTGKVSLVADRATAARLASRRLAASAAPRGANCIVEGRESAAVGAWAVVLGGARRAVLACGRPATAKQDTPEPVRVGVGFRTLTGPVRGKPRARHPPRR